MKQPTKEEHVNQTEIKTPQATLTVCFDNDAMLVVLTPRGDNRPIQINIYDRMLTVSDGGAQIHAAKINDKVTP